MRSLLAVLAVASAVVATGCSIVIDTSSVPTKVSFEHPTPLYEGLGALQGSRAVPIVVRGVELRDDDVARLHPSGRSGAVPCSESCLATEPGEFCCEGPYVGDQGLAAVLVRVPILEGADDGIAPVVLELARDGELIATGELSVQRLPELVIPNGEIIDTGFGPNEVMLLSKLEIAANGSLEFNETSSLEPRIRVTGGVEMDTGSEAVEVDAARIASYALSCAACPVGAEGTTFPLRGGGPSSTGIDGGGVLALHVDGPFLVNEQENPAGSPLFYAAPDDVDAGGGAVVVSVLGTLGRSGLTFNVSDDNVGGQVRAFLDAGADLLVTGDRSDGPRLLVGTTGSQASPLPSVTRTDVHSLNVTGGDSGRDWYVVEHDGALHTFEPRAGGGVDVTLMPGLNRVCALVDELQAIPENRAEVGQCFHSVYLP